jgi:ubiquinone biosynthesis protein
MNSVARLWKIQQIVRQFRLKEFWNDKLPPTADRGERLRLALEALGPVFIKFGQALSTRPDLIPPDVAIALAKLQDQVAPFPTAQARARIEASLGKPIDQLFARFDDVPLASASIAQVHTALLHEQDGGMKVVVKVLRPDVEKTVAKDLALLKTLANLAHTFVPIAKRVRVKEVVAEYERTAQDELDLMREAANCAQLRRNWLNSELIYHPLVFWDFTRPDVMVMERIHGVCMRELDYLREKGVDFQVLAERGVEIFFKQTFTYNFFHADMHPGNIFVNIEDIQKPSYIAVDFGIVGQLTQADQRYLAENFLAFFNRDYRRIAELHLESGWIPEGTRVEEFEAAIRTVGEPIFGRPIKEISFGFFLVRLFAIARRFDYQVQPQLVLLQKTLLNIEGLGRQLYPDLDLWKTAKPIMEDWMKQRLSPQRAINELKYQLPALAYGLPQTLERALKSLDPQFAQNRQRAQQAEQREASTKLRRTVLGVGVLFLGVITHGVVSAWISMVLLLLVVGLIWRGW